MRSPLAQVIQGSDSPSTLGRSAREVFAVDEDGSGITRLTMCNAETRRCDSSEVAPAAVSERTAAVVVRVSVATRPVTVFTVLGRTLRVLRPSQRPLEAHQRGHGDHPHEPFDRLVVGLAEPPREVGAELLRPTLSPGARPLGIAVVLPGSWHLLHLPSGAWRSLIRERFDVTSNVRDTPNDSRGPRSTPLARAGLRCAA